jgi:D-aspartate ligase
MSNNSDQRTITSRHHNKPGIIVLGGHVQALGIVRAYGRMGLKTIIIDKTSKNISRHSRYCLANYIVNDSDLLNFLLNLGKENQYQKWLVFPTNDFHVKLLSQHKQALGDFFTITTDDWTTVRVFYNKTETYILARQLGIPIANTFFPDKEEELKTINPVFPCIIKPAVMYDFFSQVKKKVFVCRNKEELINNYRKACSIIPTEEIIVQDIIKGPSRNQYSACFLFVNGKAYVSLTAIRMRQHPLDFGNATTYAETVDVPILKKYAEKLLKTSGYNGLCEVEFKKDETDGKFKLLEVNTRTWKWHAIAEKAGTPFLETYYNILTGKPAMETTTQAIASFRHGLTDAYVQCQLLLKGYAYAFRKKKPIVNAVFDLYDIKPWLFEKLNLFYLIKSR